MSRFILFCRVHNDPTAVPFLVKTDAEDTVGELKELIKNKNSPEFDSFPPHRLTLWKWNKSTDKVGAEDLDPNDILDPRMKIGDVFEGDLPREGCIVCTSS